ncbi:MAG: hypothetical protein KF779_09785 [Hyphomonadaceae bacterium]|nr:hypothetical protein [Hyphomonadaceae bacterium]
MGWLRAIPLLVLPALLYAAVAVTLDHGAIRASLDQIFLTLELPSGAVFTVTRGHAFMMLAAGLLFIEVVKSTSTSTASLVENGLAFLVFIVSFVFFLLNPAFGTIEFALIIAMMLIDFMAGFVVMTISSRRDVAWAAE